MVGRPQDGCRQLRGVIRQVVADAGVPSVLVTHDPDEAEELADLIITYDHGTVAATLPVTRPPRAPAAGLARPDGTEPLKMSLQPGNDPPLPALCLPPQILPR
jgi:hypothetical protein